MENDTFADPRVVADPVAGWRRPSLGAVVGLVAVAWGGLVASFPLDDNSFFTHLATGRLILESGGVPTADPYTFTALDSDWTVQSWLPSVLYATAERVGGAVGLRVLALILFVGAAMLVWRLTRPSMALIPRVSLFALAVFVMTPFWAMRPLMVGVIGLGLVVLALDGVFRPVLLVPVMWIWVNSHGSFPLALALVVLVMIGSRLDQVSTEVPRDVLRFVVLGMLVGAVGPLGPAALLFPLTAFERSDIFSEVVEWQAPGFTDLGTRVFLLLMAAAIFALVRTRRWSDALPAVAFVIAGLVAQRNIAMASVVLVPVVARGFGVLGTLRSSDRPKRGLLVGVLLGGLVSLFVVTAVTAPPNAVSGYPAHALAWLERSSEREGGHFAAEVGTGNLLELLDGPTGEVFVDDRFDMFPEDVLDDALTLTRGRRGWTEVLDRRDIHAVLWERSDALGSLLVASPDWTIAYSDSRWIIAARRSAE